MSTQPSARVIEDSISPEGVRLTTLEVTMHRFVLAEFNTHRVFSRNSASSRAIPVTKRIDAVKEDTAYPLEWGTNQPGMQAGEAISGIEQMHAEAEWREASNRAVSKARKLNAMRVHKQIANRLLEPFSWHTVVVTSTEWNGFMEQRCSPLAQPEIRAVAEEMANALFLSKPNELGPNGWHMPYLTDEDVAWADDTAGWGRENDAEAIDLLKMISVARCARVSYLTQNGDRDPWEDIKLFSRLVSASPMHASPLEHVATPCQCPTHYAEMVDHKGVSVFCAAREYKPDHLGNFRGWDQLRHTIEQGVRK